MPKIGVHVSKASKVIKTEKVRKTLIDAIDDDCEALKIKCCQIFVAGPANTKMSDIDYDAMNDYCGKNKISLYVHASYLTIGIFSIEKVPTAKNKSAIKHLTDQMEACDKIGALGFVVHIPRKEPAFIINALKYIIPIINKYKTPFMIEMPASKSDPDKTYETPEKINGLTELITSKFPNFTNWSWVIDTAHLWSCGVEVDSVKIMKDWFKHQKFPEKIGLFHLNGSSLEHYETGKDKHRVVFADDDDIWNQDRDLLDSAANQKKSTLDIIYKFSKKYNIDLICEINRGEYADIQFCITKLTQIFSK